MAKKRLDAIDEQIAELEHLIARADLPLGDSIRRLTAQRNTIIERLEQRGKIGLFLEGTPLNDGAVVERRKRSAVQVGELIQLPRVAADKVAYPNVIARSPLFGLSAGGGERLFRHPIAREGDLEVLVSGEFLSQADLDVWLTCLKLAEGNLTGMVEISEYAFRVRMGKTHGTKTYLLLRESLTRLALLLLTVRRGRAEYSLNERILTYELTPSDDGMRLRFWLGPTWARLLGVGDWSAQLLTLRQRLGGRPLAQLLVTVGYTHKQGFPITLESVHRAARSESTVPEFRRLAQKALDAAIAVGAFKPGSHLDRKRDLFVLER
ncbi:MAG: hypothetical protein JSR83_16575 [Proteobacteria bacterium]|nr:hypothetical protein [Pseudomonadota bacterium]